MKIDRFEIVPIYNKEQVVGFEISVDDKRLDGADYNISCGKIIIENIHAYDK